MQQSTTRRRTLLGIGTVTTVGLAGCAGGDGDGTPTDDTEETTELETTEPGTDQEGRLRVAHMSPNAPNVDVYLNMDVVLEDVAFGAVSQYLSVPAAEHEVTITPAGDSDTEVFSGPVTIAADADYTVAATGEIGDDADEAFAALVLEDDNSDVADDEARLRVVHASPDAPAVDVTAAGGDVVLFDGVSFGESGYTTVDAGDYTVEIRGDTESNDGDVVADFEVSLDGGDIYTAFAAGYLSPDDEPADTPFDLIVVQDSSA